MGMHHPVLAYCFDEAVSYFGNFIENKLAETDKKGKPKHKLSKLLGVQPKAHQLTEAELRLVFGS